MGDKRKLLGIQYLRAIAALMLVYYHLVGEIPAFTARFQFHTIIDSAHLWSGVCVFFVISGFVMYVTGRNLRPADFAWRRIARIVPLYWSITLAVCALALLDSHALHRTELTTDYAVKSLLFVPYANPGQGGQLFPLLVPGWTLNYEMAFYLVFALALFAPPKWSVWLIGAAISSSAVLGFLYPQERMYSLWGFYTSGIVLLFAAGVLLGAAYIWAGDRKLDLHVPKWACGALLILSFWLILADLPHFAIFQLVGSIVIVGAVVSWEYQHGLPRWRVPLLLGDASYSIYLVHLVAFGIVRAVWIHVHGENALAFAVLAVGSAITLALITYRLIERPSLTLLMGMASWRNERQKQRLLSASVAAGESLDGGC